MTVMDGKTDKIITTIPVGTHPGFLAVDEKTNLVYVPNDEDGTVSVIDGKTYGILNTIPIDSNFPQQIVINQKRTNSIWACTLTK